MSETTFDDDTTSAESPSRTEYPDFSADTLLCVRDLSTRFYTSEGQVNAVESLDFELKEGEVLGIVGESGSGKSVTGLSILNLVDSPGRITDGEIWLRNERLAASYRDRRPAAVHGEFVDLRGLPLEEWRSLRGSSFSMVFQDPMSSFSPTNTVGEQIAEAVEVERRSQGDRTDDRDYGLPSMVLGTVFRSQRYVSRESRERAIELLERVGIPDPRNRADEYPHQFSGGMLQRAMIAQALAGEPDVLVADEPTTALDVTIQAQIITLLDELREEQGMSIVFITHNINVLSYIADRIGVMYAGEIVEQGTPTEIFDDHVHPYTEGLLGSIPEVAETTTGAERLAPIPGNVPSLLDHEMGDGCYFADRCPKAMEQCLSKPPEYDVGGGHGAKCYLAAHEYDPTQKLEPGRSDGGRR